MVSQTDISNNTSDIKRTRNSKELPLESAGFDMERFIKSPLLVKLFKGDGILNITPITITGVTKDYYGTIVDQISDELFKITESEDGSCNYQVGFTVHFTGTKDDVHIFYAFDSNWVLDEDSKIKEWLLSEYESRSVAIISSEVRGWGEKKINNMLDILHDKLPSYENVSSLGFRVTSKSKTTKKTTTKITTSDAQKQRTSFDENIAKIIKTLVAQQASLEKKLEEQQEIITKLLATTSLNNN